MTRGQRSLGIVLTCEHATNRVPARYAAVFKGAKSVLESHRGYDPGALQMARAVARVVGVKSIESRATRLLVECNRSIGHPRLFSEFTKGLSEEERERIIAKWYAPHIERVEREVQRVMRARRPVLHVGVHTFTPVLDGVTRNVDVGVLYDPSRSLEEGVADRWVGLLKEGLPGLRVRRNAPYRGVSDGLTTMLRKKHPAGAYAGIEIEVNQAIAAGSDSDLKSAVTDVLARTLREVAGVRAE